MGDNWEYLVIYQDQRERVLVALSSLVYLASNRGAHCALCHIHSARFLKIQPDHLHHTLTCLAIGSVFVSMYGEWEWMPC
jgi:hypothetical protein